MKKVCIFTVTILLMYVTSVSAWNESKTHPELTTKALENSGLYGVDGYLVKVLGLSDGTDTRLEGPEKKEKSGDYIKVAEKSVLEWLRYGGTLEDAESLCRASNHFHNPLKSWDSSGLSGITDTWPQWLWCTFASTCEYPPWYMESALTWASGFASPGTPDESVRNRNLWDWESAKDYYFKYLAGL